MNLYHFLILLVSNAMFFVLSRCTSCAYFVASIKLFDSFSINTLVYVFAIYN